jgi:hypothetical protein
MFISRLHQPQLSGHKVSVRWFVQRQETKRDLYPVNLTSSIMFANPEEGT